MMCEMSIYEVPTKGTGNQFKNLLDIFKTNFCIFNFSPANRVGLQIMKCKSERHSNKAFFMIDAYKKN